MNISSFGIGHIFTTGDSLHSDGIIHVGGKRFERNSPSVTKDWPINPARHITKNHFERTRLSNSDIDRAPQWTRVAEEVGAFFDGLDFLFITFAEGQKKWFERVILRSSNSPPELVDLGFMGNFFTPDLQDVGLGWIHPRIVPRKGTDLDWSQSKWTGSAPRLPVLIESHTQLLIDILDRISAHFSSSTDSEAQRTFSPVYSLLSVGAIGSHDNSHGLGWIKRLAEEAEDFTWSNSSAENPLQMGFTDFYAPKTPIDGNFATKKAKLVCDLLRQSIPAAALDGPKNKKSIQEVHPVNLERVKDVFRHLSKTSHLKPRPTQDAYAEFITQSINEDPTTEPSDAEGNLYAIEAGTGTGKTLGYLVPACQFATANKSRSVLIATATKNLQNQIHTNEIPLLTDHDKTGVYEDITSAILKGKGNYLCLDAFLNFYKSITAAEKPPIDKTLAWIHIYIVLKECMGVIENIPSSVYRALGPMKSLLTEINSRDNCLFTLPQAESDPDGEERARQIVEHAGCGYSRALADALHADIVITNHHKLPQLAESITEHVEACIIDEADHLPDNLRSALTVELDEDEFRRRLLAPLWGRSDRRGFLQIVADRVRKESKIDEANHSGETEVSASELLRDLDTTQELEHTITDALKSIGAAISERPYRPKRWVNLKPMNSGESICKCLSTLHSALSSTIELLRRIIASRRYNLERKEGVIRKEWKRLRKYITICHGYESSTKEIGSCYPSEEYVHVVEIRRNKQRTWILSRIPFDIREAVRDCLRRRFRSSILTSATLYSNNTLKLFKEDLCLSEDFDKSKQIDTPFDYGRQVLGGVFTFLPNFNYSAPIDYKEGWARDIGAAISILCKSTYGRTLVLFTNTKEMKKIHGIVDCRLKAHDIPVYLQSKNHRQDVHRFHGEQHSVLFGVNRFWNGVDFPGKTLSQLIIVRLPNPALSSALIEHRKAIMGQDFWSRYYHPTSQLMLRQGFGRLIRKETDRGVFVILDGRLHTDPNMASLGQGVPVGLHTVSEITSTDGPMNLHTFVDKSLAMLGFTPEFLDRGLSVDSLIQEYHA